MSPQKPRGSSRKKQTEPEQQESDPNQRVPRSFYVRRELLARARDAATYCGAYVPESGVQNLSDLIEPALEKSIKDLERKYHDGKPFPTVGTMPTGRPRR